MGSPRGCESSDGASQGLRDSTCMADPPRSRLLGSVEGVFIGFNGSHLSPPGGAQNRGHGSCFYLTSASKEGKGTRFTTFGLPAPALH